LDFMVLKASDFFCSFSWQIFFKTPETPVMDGMVCFHQKTMLLVSFIVFSVGFFLGFCVSTFLAKTEARAPGRFTHNTIAEVLWTAIPAVLLAMLLVPSFALLFSIEELPDPQGTLKCQGRQWHWCYEYRDLYSSRRYLIPIQAEVKPPTRCGTCSFYLVAGYCNSFGVLACFSCLL
jgi:heme/copper-type cytochrome/quinol oxidase subunit 2